MTIAWRGALLVVVLLLAWRSLSQGLGDYYSRNPEDAADSARTRTALAWDPGQRVALGLLGAARSAASVPSSAPNSAANSAQGSAQEATRTWEALLRLDPTDAGAMLGLAELTADPDRGDALVRAAVALHPTSPAVLKRAAVYWIKRDAPDRAMAAWSDAMIADPGERKGILAILLKLFEEPRTRGLLMPYTVAPPDWWDDFFREVAAAASDVETVRALAAVRRTGSAVPLSPAERAAYVARLRKEGLTTEAYLTWVNGLDEVRRQGLGLINNGSFEYDPAPDGWDWRLRPTDNLAMEIAPTMGAEGKRALHLAFRGFDQDFRQVGQDLFLEPGAYRLSGMVRPNGLKTSGGLKWVVDCVSQARTTRLAETERFVGSASWQTFDLKFAIPDGCERPVLRLVGAVRTSGDRQIEGGIWFDALRIQRADGGVG